MRHDQGRLTHSGEAMTEIEKARDALCKAALAQFRAHLDKNNQTVEQWLSALKADGRSARTLTLIRACARLDKLERP